MADSNNAEVLKRLNELHNSLIQARHEMKEAPEERMTGLVEKMAQDAISATEHCMLRSRVETILKGLIFDTISDRESSIPRAHQDTFEWSLSETNPTLSGWLRSGNGVYWIEGKAGSGKSTLMKFLQQDPRTLSMLNEWAGGRPMAAVSHYFWAPGTKVQTSLLGLFRTLLFQIFVKAPELVKVICPSRMRQGSFAHMQPWTLEQLEACFDSLSKMHLPIKLCFFIDGLDEFEGDPQVLIDIIRLISKSNDIKLCVASRPWVPFQNAFGYSSQKLSVHEFTREDIKLYAYDKLGQNDEYQKLQVQFSEQAESLIDEISDAADGVFLWVYLVVRQLLDGLSSNDDIPTLRRRLRALPRDLNDYFDRMLKSIEDVYLDEVQSLLGILAYTRLPLNTFLTWAHRKAHKTGVASSEINILEFPPHDNYRTIERTFHRFSDDLPANEKYNGKIEKRRIVARCRDLIHVSREEATIAYPGVYGFRVGFLHRTVAEYVGPALASDARRKRVDGSVRSLLPIVALAETYQAIAVSMLDIDIAMEYQRRVVSLALEAKQHSPAAYLHIMHRLFFSRRHGYIDREMLAAAMTSDVFVLGCTCDTVISSGVGFFWALHCRDCRANYVHLADHVGGVFLANCFHTLHLYFFATDGKLTTKEISEVNLGVVKMLIRAALSKGQRTFIDTWRCGIRFLENALERNERLPTNIYDVCLVFIRQGAPRLLVISRNAVDALTILQKVPSIQKADPIGDLLRDEFRRGEHVFKARTKLEEQEEPEGQKEPEGQGKSWFQTIFMG